MVTLEGWDAGAAVELYRGFAVSPEERELERLSDVLDTAIR